MANMWNPDHTGVVIESSRGYTTLNPIEILAGEKRILFCASEIDQATVNELISKLLYLDSISHDVITLIINSPGGSVEAGMALYDVMQLIRSPIKTIAMGAAYSMGAILVTGGTKGMRMALKHTKIMIHEPILVGGTGGSTSRLKDLADDMLKTKKTIDGIIAKHTGKRLKEIEKNTSYDHYFSAEQAVEFGLIDEVLEGERWYE